MSEHTITCHDVIILGGGAAGLFCALTAAKRGRKVLILEKSNKIGKKILMSGGGRCNFTNLGVDAENYLSANPHFCKSALTRYSQWDFIGLVEKHGIAYEQRGHGRLFCVNSAKDILAMLLVECQEAGVHIEENCNIESIQQLVDSGEYQYQLIEADSARRCHSLVVATGALSIPTLGGSDFGYEIANQFGLTLLPRRAGLVPLMFSDDLKPLCQRLSGVSIDAEVSCAGQSFREDLLFTHRGLSGPVILQISNYWQPGGEIEVNLLPDLDIRHWLLTAKITQEKLQLNTLLAQKLPRALVIELQNLWFSASAGDPLANISDRLLSEIAGKLARWVLKPASSEGYRTAEVTLGGVNTDNISSKTMVSRDNPGLYFIGEVLDVTGHLGGYNFQWAWSSGFVAGMSA